MFRKKLSSSWGRCLSSFLSLFQYLQSYLILTQYIFKNGIWQWRNFRCLFCQMWWRKIFQYHWNKGKYCSHMSLNLENTMTHFTFWKHNIKLILNRKKHAHNCNTCNKTDWEPCVCGAQLSCGGWAILLSVTDWQQRVFVAQKNNTQEREGNLTKGLTNRGTQT